MNTNYFKTSINTNLIADYINTESYTKLLFKIIQEKSNYKYPLSLSFQDLKGILSEQYKTTIEIYKPNLYRKQMDLKKSSVNLPLKPGSILAPKREILSEKLDNAKDDWKFIKELTDRTVNFFIYRERAIEKIKNYSLSEQTRLLNHERDPTRKRLAGDDLYGNQNRGAIRLGPRSGY